jgi:MoaA/NifB/PqqE/SkfB family radical SAM enzyme
MFKIENRWKHYADSVKIEWNLGKRCNLDCTYCPAEIHDNFSPHTRLDKLMHTVDKIAKLQNPRISFTGGEPTVHPAFEKLLEYARSKIKWLSVTTNGTRTLDFYERIPVNYIVFSLHFEDPHWKRRLQTVLDFATTTESMSHPKDFHIALMAHQDYMPEVKHAASFLTGFNVPFTVRRIRWTEKHDWFDDLKYNQNDLDWILNVNATADANTLIDDFELAHANDVIKQHRNKFKDWNCKAGIESLMINWDGEVHRATCRVGGSLGNIYNDSFEQPEDPIVCTREWCTCAADVNITKWK